MQNDLRDDEGFTLLEVIVAFAILALTLVATNQSVAMATSQIRRSEEIQQAEILAQDVLVEIMLGSTVPRSSSGDGPSKLRWRLSSEQLRIATGSPLARLTLEISTDSGRKVRDYVTFLSREIERE
jgi:general secretion pathway protein I